ALGRGAVGVATDSFGEYPVGKDDAGGDGLLSLYPLTASGPLVLSRFVNYYIPGDGYIVGVHNLYRVNADGTAMTRLDNQNGHEDLNPAFSPDGTSILFGTSVAGLGADLWRMGSDGSSPTDLGVTGKTPRFNAAGTRIAFARNGFPYEAIFTANPDGTSPTQLTGGADSNLDPTFSPDGTKLAWANRDGNDYEIAVMNANGTSPVRLTNNSEQDTFPDYSPDGTKIVYADSGLASGIYVLNADGSGTPTQL